MTRARKRLLTTVLVLGLLAISPNTHGSGPAETDQIDVYGVSSGCRYAPVGELLDCRIVADIYPYRKLHFQLGEHPIGMNIDAESGIIGWTPTLDQLGRHRVVVVVSVWDKRGVATQDVGSVHVVLPSPNDFHAEIVHDWVKLTWAPVPGAVSYKLRWLNTGDQIAEVFSESYIDRGPRPDEDDFYVINAVDHTGERSADIWIPVPE